MALEHAHGAIQWNAADGVGTDYTVSGLSFQPKGVRFYWMGLGSASDANSATTHFRAGVGFATGPTDRRCVSVMEADAAGTSFGGSVCKSECIAATMSIAATPAQDGMLDYTATNSDGFTLTVMDQAPANLTLFWDAWGGSDISVAQIVDISEPAAAGNVDYTVTGFVAGATDQVVMLAGCQSTAAINTVQNTDSGLMAGFATGGAAAENIVSAINSDDASGTMDTQNYSLAGECLAMMAVAGGNPTARAQLTQFGTDNFRLNWIARATTGRKYIALAMKGGQWKAGSFNIDATVVGNTATVTGLPFQPKGISFLDAGGDAQPAGTATTPGRFILGSASSPTSRRSMGAFMANASTTSSLGLVMGYSAAIIKSSSSGTVGMAADLNSITSDGFQLIIDVIGNDAIDWIGYLAFADTAGGGAANLILADGAQAHSSDNLTLTTPVNLAIADAVQSQLADNVALTQVHLLTVQDATQAQLADNVTLVQTYTLAIQEATQAQPADNLALTQLSTLAIQEAAHVQSADNITLTQLHLLTIQDATQTQPTDNVALIPNLMIAEATHGQAADNLTLTAIGELTISDASHTQTADNIVFTQEHNVIVQDAAHAHSADSLALVQIHYLVLGDATHAQAADNTTLVTPSQLTVQDALHGGGGGFATQLIVSVME